MKKICTKYRRIISEIPSPELLPFIKELRSYEPKSMSKSFPMVWDYAEGINVWDGWGNKFIDFTSSVIVANVGHSNYEIGEAIKSQVDRQLFHNFSDPYFGKLEYFKKLREILPEYLDKIVLLTTGSEAMECTIRIMREYGQKRNFRKIDVISHSGSFHGLTMGARALSQSADVHDPPGFYHIRFPNCNFCPWGNEKYDDCGRKCFNWSIDDWNIDGDSIAGVIVETFRGPSATFMPEDYVRELRKWTLRHNALLVFDEIQAGFGRTGKWFGFEYYDVEPDLIVVGKGMTSSLPMSAVIGRAKILDSVDGLHSTHSGNPLCIAAGMANIEVLDKCGMVHNARHLGRVCFRELRKLRKEYSEYVGAINGKGLAIASYLLDPQTGRTNPELVRKVIDRCRQLGLLLLPTEAAGTIKIAPPLCISEEVLLEGIGVIGEAIKKEK